MLDLLGRPYSRALEIGCAAGVFTAALAERCTTLHVVDAIPQAIDHCLKRLGDLPNVYYSLADIGTWPGTGETYELIVVGEVLYYLGSRQQIRSAVRKISSWVQTGGTLIFSSLVDAAATRSNLIGAETAMQEWKRYLHEEAQYSCHGQPDEESLVVKYRRTP